MAMADAAFSQPSVIARPSNPEVIRLHRELQIWMMHTRYHLQGVDNQPVWRMHNTSLTLGTGGGIGTFFVFRKFVPKLKFPFSFIPPTVLFYLTYRASQVQQLPNLYGALLTLPTPLGAKGREVLSALRDGGAQLPSQEFANQKAPPQEYIAKRGEGDSLLPINNPDEAPGGAVNPDDAQTRASELFYGASEPSQQALPPKAPASAPELAPVADPWAADSSFGGAAPGVADDGWPTEQATPQAKTRSSWEQIRARQAAAAGADRS